MILVSEPPRNQSKSSIHMKGMPGIGLSLPLIIFCSWPLFMMDRMDVRVLGGLELRGFSEQHISAAITARPDVNGRTLLYLAAYMGDIAWINDLLASGFRADTPDRWGITALDVAEQQGNLDAVEVLRRSIGKCHRDR